MKKSIFQLWKLFLKERQYKKQKAEGNGALLVDAYTDPSFLKDLIRGTNKVIEVFTLDGAHIIIKPDNEKKQTKVDWERE